MPNQQRLSLLPSRLEHRAGLRPSREQRWRLQRGGASCAAAPEPGNQGTEGGRNVTLKPDLEASARLLL
jgi:hypothetical protein